MINIRKTALLVAASFLLSFSVETRAFGVNSPRKASTSIRSATALEGSSSNRRGVLSGIKRVVVGAATLAVFRQPKVAIADDSSPTDGRIVELTVANLDGVPGNTGTIKIQLRPEWAPRGVQRFEVCIPKSVARFE